MARSRSPFRAGPPTLPGGDDGSYLRLRKVGRKQELARATLSVAVHTAFSALAGLASARLRHIDSLHRSSR